MGPSCPSQQGAAFRQVFIIQDLLKNEEGYERRREVPYIIYNDGSSRSNDCWRDRNMH